MGIQTKRMTQETEQKMTKREKSELFDLVYIQFKLKSFDCAAARREAHSKISEASRVECQRYKWPRRSGQQSYRIPRCGGQVVAAVVAQVLSDVNSRVHSACVSRDVIVSRKQRIDIKRYSGKKNKLQEGKSDTVNTLQFCTEYNYNMSTIDENMHSLEAIKKSQKTLTLGLQ